MELMEEANGEDGSHVHAADAFPPSLTLTPLRHTKVLHFVRHGEGFHNVAGLANEAEYLNPRWTDAHLTPLGWQQAAALRWHVAGLQERGEIRVEAVVVSPLRRALETAAAAFGGGPWAEGAGPPLMLAQSEVTGLRAAQGAISSASCPPFIAYEGCREHFGMHYCDKRRSISEAKACFPGVDFSLVESDQDELWRNDVRETNAEVKRRGLHFLQWLMRRPESHIAVVAHGGLLFHALSNFRAAPPIQSELHRFFDNAELRSLVLANELGTDHPERTHFPGGRKACPNLISPPPAPASLSPKLSNMVMDAKPQHAVKRAASAVCRAIPAGVHASSLFRIAL